MQRTEENQKNDSETICWCSGVTRGEIVKAYNNGARTLSEIQQMTGACTVGRCAELSPKKRCCAPDIRALLKELSLKND